ncbi:PP2C-domain-containing protein [Auriculariales sp. MPI-PUGE-AT-0066]|nr:PP2C-domain-containing protein [Auriculariales sp. MPI-PUGE-AT-0066]
MGQTLSQPITDKHTTTGADERYLYAVSEMQGWRISMEDAHTTELKLNSDDPNTFFAVYDGHGGSTVARYAGRNVHRRLTNEESYHEKNYEKALKQAFLGTDEDMRADPAFMHDPSGCTAVAVLIADDGKMYCANAGDSRSVLSSQGTAKPLSFDHKPQSQTETARIVAAGGYIEYGRVNGNLALSRALGDFDFKKNYALGPEKQVITADPDITQHELNEEDEFLVLACDGIWDCLSSQQVINIVRRQVAEGKELAEICELIIDRCLSQDSSTQGGIGCDNMTLSIVAILGGRDKDAWYTWIKDRVERNHGFPTPAGLPELYPHHRANYIPAPRANGVMSRGFGGGIAFYPGGTNLFTEAASAYTYDSSDSEPDNDHEDHEAKVGSITEVQDEAKQEENDHQDNNAQPQIGEDDESISFTIHAPAAKQVDVVPPSTRAEGDKAVGVNVNGRAAEDSDSDSVMTERSDDGDAATEGVHPTSASRDATLLGSTAGLRTVGSPLVAQNDHATNGSSNPAVQPSPAAHSPVTAATTSSST